MQNRATRRLLMMTISAASFSAIPGQTSPNPEEDAAEILLIATFPLISQALAFSLATRSSEGRDFSPE
jgi:hypothetical protein